MNIICPRCKKPTHCTFGVEGKQDCPHCIKGCKKVPGKPNIWR